MSKCRKEKQRRGTEERKTARRYMKGRGVEIQTPIREEDERAEEEGQCCLQLDLRVTLAGAVSVDAFICRTAQS